MNTQYAIADLDKLFYFIDRKDYVPISYGIGDPTIVHTTSETRKKMMKKDKLADIKSNCISYVDGISTTAKGKWVTQAKESFKEITGKLDKC